MDSPAVTDLNHALLFPPHANDIDRVMGGDRAHASAGAELDPQVLLQAEGRDGYPIITGEGSDLGASSDHARHPDRCWAHAGVRR